MHNSGTFLQSINYLETVRRLFSDPLAFTPEQLARVEAAKADTSSAYDQVLELASAQYREYRIVRDEIDAAWTTTNPRFFAPSPFIPDQWDRLGELMFYYLPDTRIKLTIKDTYLVGVVPTWFSVESDDVLDPNDELHRRLCAMLFTTVTEFNQMHFTIRHHDGHERPWQFDDPTMVSFGAERRSHLARREPHAGG